MTFYPLRKWVQGVLVLLSFGNLALLLFAHLSGVLGIALDALIWGALCYHWFAQWQRKKRLPDPARIKQLERELGLS